MRPLFVAGATGAGKSAVALALAELLGGEIVNADAYQLYRGLEIVSAAPTPPDRERVPHHLYGCLDPDVECNASRFAGLANAAIHEVLGRGRLPIVAGGSGLYLKSLTHGLTELPPADPELREQLEGLSLEELVAKLHTLDPKGAAVIDLQNRRYVTRAVEISMLSGRPASELKNEWSQTAPEFDGVLLQRPREDLYGRIDARVPAMVEAGLLAEIARLPDSLSVTAGKAIGVREVRAHLAGQASLEECVAAIAQASRRYAKRQLTWFRREPGFQRVCLAADESPESAARRCVALFPHLPHAGS